MCLSCLCRAVECGGTIWETDLCLPPLLEHAVQHTELSGGKGTCLAYCCFEAHGMKKGITHTDARKVWVSKHEQVRKEELVEGWPSWTNGKQLGGIANHGGDRVKDLLDIAFAVAKKKEIHGEDARKDHLSGHLYVDVSQCASRRPWSEGRVRAVTTSTDIFSFKSPPNIDPH